MQYSVEEVDPQRVGLLSFLPDNNSTKFILLLVLFSTSLLQAEVVKESKTLGQTKEFKKLKLYGVSEWMSASSSVASESINVLGLGFLLDYSLTDKYGFAGSMRQSFTSIGGNSTITALDVRAPWFIGSVSEMLT